MRRVLNSLRILRMTQAAASVLILLLVAIFVLPSYSGAVDPSSLSVVQTNDSAEAGGKNIVDVCVCVCVCERLQLLPINAAENRFYSLNCKKNISKLNENKNAFQ